MLALVCFYGISKLTVENRFIDYFKQDTEIYQGMLAIDQNLGGTTPLDIIWRFAPQASERSEDSTETNEDCFLDDECFDDAQATLFVPAKIRKLKEIQAYLESVPQLGKVNSLVNAVKVAEQINGGELDNIQLALLPALVPDNLKAQLINPYYSEAAGEVRFSIRVIDSDKSLNRKQLVEDIRSHLTNQLGLAEEDVSLAGMVVLYNNMLQSLFDSQIKTIALVFIVIMAMFYLLFRSLLVAMVAIVPNVLAAVVVLGTMGLLGIPLDMMTITIAAISVGIAVDDTVHYVYRFKKEFQRDKNYLATMYRAHGSIGKAMYYTSVTIVIGFSILAFSNFNPTLYFGVFTALAMVIALLAALTLLPQLICMVKPFGPERAKA